MSAIAEDSHTLIIGGTRGIGRALVRTLAQVNHLLSVVGRRAPSEADEGIPNVRYWVIDLLREEELRKTMGEVITHNGKINNLVFFQRYRGDEDAWTGELETSLTSTKNVIESLAEDFATTGRKSIVMVGSVASRFVVDEQPVSYHVAKAGLAQMVRYYAVSLGPKAITVNSVMPCTVLKDESKRFYLENEPLLSLYKTITPLGRMGTAEDVADAIAFLCSDQASFITGQNIVVDGGVSLRGHESMARQLVSLERANVARKDG